MTVMFLDDMMERHRSFKYVAPTDVEVKYVYTAQQAIDYIEAEHPTQVFLDHDLSEEDIMVAVGGKSSVPTGMTVVDHILKMDRPPMSIVVHSCNGPAAEEMVARLKEHPAGIKVLRIPFPHLMHSMRESRKT